MRRKKNKRFYIMKRIVIFIVFVGVLFFIQKLTAPKWINGNEEVVSRSEDGVHEQWNEYSAQNDEQKVLR